MTFLPVAIIPFAPGGGETAPLTTGRDYVLYSFQYRFPLLDIVKRKAMAPLPAGDGARPPAGGRPATGK